MTVEWREDRRKPGAWMASDDDPAYEASAYPDGFRIEQGTLSIEMDAENLEQAKRFAEAALAWIPELDKRFAAVDAEQRLEGVRLPSHPPKGESRLLMKKVELYHDVYCPHCQSGLKHESREICSCVSAYT